ncbi:hypothetical protein CLF_108855 [Clonorchis sinensis]|uniref:Uncharacterized protein n=1 Tax=Clonorchis sinensis TaxID=79923 RepID=G7YIM7_CLOSI|nr:hypothetical protein CLF_108855 [Clonorchis sinensis]
MESNQTNDSKTQYYTRSYYEVVWVYRLPSGERLHFQRFFIKRQKSNEMHQTIDRKSVVRIRPLHLDFPFLGNLAVYQSSCFFRVACIDRIRDSFEAVNYIHPSDVKTLLLSSSVSLDEDDGFFPTRDSVFGLFLRKFALGFHHQSFEEMCKFKYSFLKAYDKATSFKRIKYPFAQPNSCNLQLLNSSTRTHTSETALQISSAVGQLGGRPGLDTKELDETFSRCKNLFPELPAPYYAAHLLAIRKRNISEAVDNLCSYFETRMASEWSDKGLKNTCAYMAVASANMHLSFGHWLRGKCLEKEALKKSLESESGASLNHLKITHSLLNTDTASFRYDSQIPQRIINRMPVGSLPKGATTQKRLFLLYFNSPVTMLPACFSICLLDIATVWSLYGYPILYTALLQCVINADCLQPCPMSDVVLSTAFAGMIKEFSASGAVNEALNLANCVETVICRFSEKSTIHQARLQVELEQALRSGVDLAQCDRLVNALRLCCPWEAALYQAEVERLRGNCVTSHDLLQHVVQSALCRLKSATIKTSEVTSGAADSSTSRLNSSITFHVEPFSHLSIPVFDQHVPLGGIARLAQIAVRAQFALHALRTLHSAPSSEPSVELDRVLCEALHQSDHSTQWRCLTYASRLRLRSSAELHNYHWMSARSLSMIDARKSIPAGNEYDGARKSLKRQIVKSLRKDRELCYLSPLPTSSENETVAARASYGRYADLTADGVDELSSNQEIISGFAEYLCSNTVARYTSFGGKGNCCCGVFVCELKQTFRRASYFMFDVVQDERLLFAWGPSVLQFHIQQLYGALTFYRSVDDRRRILDILALLAVALNCGGHTKERNELANAFHELRKECQFADTFLRGKHVVAVL